MFEILLARYFRKPVLKITWILLGVAVIFLLLVLGTSYFTIVSNWALVIIAVLLLVSILVFAAVAYKPLSSTLQHQNIMFSTKTRAAKVLARLLERVLRAEAEKLWKELSGDAGEDFIDGFGELLATLILFGSTISMLAGYAVKIIKETCPDSMTLKLIEATPDSDVAPTKLILHWVSIKGKRVIDKTFVVYLARPRVFDYALSGPSAAEALERLKDDINPEESLSTGNTTATAEQTPATGGMEK